MKYIKNKFKLFFSILLIILCSASFITKANDAFPSPTNLKYVNDYANIISDSYKEKIVSIGKELEDKTSAQAIIVIIDSTNGTPIEDYSNKLFRTWGIGQKDRDNGLLILLSLIV